jgi:hypothetical protein
MYKDGVRTPLEEGSDFLIRGKYLKGDVPKQAYYMPNLTDVYYPDKEEGYYLIDDDAYYAVVAVAPDESVTDEDMPRPQLSMQPPSPPMNDGMLLKGDLKILELPYRFPDKTHEATDPKRPQRRQYMVGNILLTSLDPGSPHPLGYSETYEKQQVGNENWELYGHDVYEDETLDQAHDKHCFDLASVNSGDPGRTNLWNEENYFSNCFKTWYYRWAAHLYNSVTSPDVVLAKYDKFKYVDPEPNARSRPRSNTLSAWMVKTCRFAVPNRISRLMYTQERSLVMYHTWDTNTSL